METGGTEVTITRLVPCTLCGKKHRVKMNALLPNDLEIPLSSEGRPWCEVLELKRQNHYKCNKQRVLEYKKVWYQKHKKGLLLQDAANRLRSGRTRQPHAKTLKKLKEAGVEFDDNNRILCVKTATSDSMAAVDETKASNP